jgi:hypothetical protein
MLLHFSVDRRGVGSQVGVSPYHIPNKISKISKRAFTMFAGEDDPSTDDASEKNPNQKKPKKGTLNKRNKRQASRPLVAASLHKLPICLTYRLIHKLANCYCGIT